MQPTESHTPPTTAHVERHAVAPAIAEVYWQAVQTRDAALDRSFVYAVATTGVFCRASCSSRRPLRKNVRFFETAVQATAAGYRACLRCRPDQPGCTQADPAAQAMEAACRWLEQHPDSPARYTEFAARAGMGAAHFHRTFKRVVGVTPKR